MIIQKEDFSEFRKEASSLIAPYLSEIVSAFEKEIDWDNYQGLSDGGFLHVIGAREGGVLKGFLALFVFFHPNAKGVKVAQEVGMFLLPEERRGLAGARLIRSAKKLAIELGCRYMTITTRPGKELGPLLTALGGKAIETTYLMEI